MECWHLDLFLGLIIFVSSPKKTMFFTVTSWARSTSTSCFTSNRVWLTPPGRGICSPGPGGVHGSESPWLCCHRRWPWHRSPCRSCGGVESSRTAWWQTLGSSALLRDGPQPWRSYSLWPRSPPSSVAPEVMGNEVWAKAHKHPFMDVHRKHTMTY